jgi:ketosteroid isomerase-like protein
MSRENVKLVKDLYEAWNRSGGVPQLELMDPGIEVVVSGGLGDGIYRGHAGISEVLESFWDYFADHRIDVEELVPAGQDVVVTVHYYGRGKTSGVEVDMRHWHVWTLRDGKLVRWKVLNTRREALEAVQLSEHDAHAAS